MTRTEEEEDGDEDGVNDAVIAGVVAGATAVVLAVAVLGVCRDVEERKCLKISRIFSIFEYSYYWVTDPATNLCCITVDWIHAGLGEC